MRAAAALLALLGLVVAACWTPPARAATDARMAAAEIPLVGPWQFRFGNDPRWASPGLDDSDWQALDLTPLPGAHDGDVGIPDYVPGWTARGHAGQSGHAWYRLRVHWSVPRGTRPVLIGPALVDDAYEIFWNGRRIGGIGDFSTDPPRAFPARPSLYALSETASSGDALVAVHVHMDPSSASAPEAGGMHVAPILAESAAGHARWLAQWWQTFWGYVVEVLEPALLLGLALYAMSLRRLCPPDRFWSAIALVAMGALRLNQAVAAWTQIETLRTYGIVRSVVVGPLVLAAWPIAWNRWAPRPDRRIDAAAIMLAILAAIAALAGHRLQAVHFGSRLASLVLFAWAGWNIGRQGPGRFLALVAMVAVGVAMFAEELSAIGVPGIWFRSASASRGASTRCSPRCRCSPPCSIAAPHGACARPQPHELNIADALRRSARVGTAHTDFAAGTLQGGSTR